MAVTTIDTDDHLLERAVGGDREALANLLERHLHPAWRIALAASPSPAAAADVVVSGVCDALLAATRTPDPAVSLRTRIAASVHATAVAADRASSRPAATHDDPVINAFLALPVAARTALWLTEVEGGEPAQVAPVLRCERSVAAALAGRAAASLRDRLAADAAANATDPECTSILGKLPAHAAGRLTADERARMSAHLAGCGACAASLASVVAPRPALRRLVVAVPATLAGAIAERWDEAREGDGVPVARRWSERTIGAAAAGILAVGLAGAVLLGRGGGSPTVAEFASPTPIDLSSLADEDADETPAVEPVTRPTAPTITPAVLGSGSSRGTSGGGTGGGGGGGTGGGGGGERSRGDDPSTPTTTGSTPTTSTPTTPTSEQPTTDTTTPPTTPTTTAPGGGDGTEAPPATDGGGTEIEVPGLATVTVGDVGSDDPILEVEIAGLPPVTIPNLLP